MIQGKKKIIVSYWRGTKCTQTPWDHNQEFEYTTKKRNQIIGKILDNGLSVMARWLPLKDQNGIETLVIYVDDYKFTQQ